MKKIILSLLLFTSILKATADEGMWLPMLLGEQVYNDMVKRGLKLSKEKLYSINRSSIKDAIIIFGAGCTGEIVSNQGLIFTNHHCGYSAIAGASTIDHNYLANGFYAKSMAEEIQSGLTVQFLNAITDVTKEVEAALNGATGANRIAKLPAILKSITDKVLDEKKGVAARISSMFKGNQFLMFTYQTYFDIRLVGAPPESIGKFGGDTDNWEWPRHTGDFSVFRVYMGKDGNPAKFSPDNVPYKPKHFLPVSIKGIKDGDYAMIYGYPGSTNRYETSMGVKLKTDISNPTLVKLRDMRLKYMFEEMQKDPAIKLKLASNYATVANYWKFYDGETKQLLKFKTFEQKQQFESEFNKWAAGKPGFENIFNQYAANYNEWTQYEKHRVYIAEGLSGCALIASSSGFLTLADAMLKGDFSKNITAHENDGKTYLDNNDLPSDERILAKVLEMYYGDVDQSQHPKGFYEMMEKGYGDLQDPETYKKFAKAVFASSMLVHKELWEAYKNNPTMDVLNKDLGYMVNKAFFGNWTGNYFSKLKKFNDANTEAGRLYLKGIMQMNPVAAKKMYPDANSNMRVSFGNVQSYVPRDAVQYDYVCTAAGLLQKYVKGDYEFDLPDYVLDAVRNKDYGQYADKKKKDLVVTFITNNDITGGNSGSPVLNNQGELIGLAFDGNYEALSHKIAFDKDLNRTICVDIRYVLWCIDKLGGANNLIMELDLKK
jgi:hypothetical protein